MVMPPDGHRNPTKPPAGWPDVTKNGLASETTAHARATTNPGDDPAMPPAPPALGTPRTDAAIASYEHWIQYTNQYGHIPEAMEQAPAEADPFEIARTLECELADLLHDMERLVEADCEHLAELAAANRRPNAKPPEVERQLKEIREKVAADCLVYPSKHEARELIAALEEFAHDLGRRLAGAMNYSAALQTSYEVEINRAEAAERRAGTSEARAHDAEARWQQEWDAREAAERQLQDEVTRHLETGNVLMITQRQHAEAKDYIRQMDRVIDDECVARSCISPLEDLKQAIRSLKTQAPEAGAKKRCAKECELFGRNNPGDAAYYAKHIAAAIRQGSEQEAGITCRHGVVGYCEQCNLQDPYELGEKKPHLVSGSEREGGGT